MKPATAETVIVITYLCPRGHRYERTYTERMKLHLTVTCACGETMQAIGSREVQKAQAG